MMLAALLAVLIIGGISGWLYAHGLIGQSHEPGPVPAGQSQHASHPQRHRSADPTPSHEVLNRGTAPVPDAGETASDTRMAAIRTMVESSLAGRNGTWSVYVEDLESGETVSVNEQPMVAASEIKLYVMLTVYDRLNAGTLNDGGRDIASLVNQMITVSSNEATNQLVLIIGDGTMATGMQRVTDTAARYGFGSSRQLRSLSDTGTDGSGAENWTSAADCGAFLSGLYHGKLVSGEASTTMLSMLSGQTRRAKIPAGVPEGIQVANKTGELPGVENDAAIIWGRAADGSSRDYALVVMASGIDSGTAQQQIAALSAQVYAGMTA
jgi:beta-lactamase class A